MKRLLLAAFLFTAFGSFAPLAPASAQQAAQVEPKLLFGSRINEVDAYLTRSRAEDARKVFNDLAGSMQMFIAETKNAKASTIYTEAKILSADLPKNHTALVAKLREFLELM